MIMFADFIVLRKRNATIYVTENFAILNEKVFILVKIFIYFDHQLKAICYKNLNKTF